MHKIILELIETNIGYPVICDFGMAAKLEDNFILRISDLDRPGGNTSHLAPEILNTYHQQKKEKKREIVLDYSKQTSFEFGVICYEILCGCIHPLPRYPPLKFPIQIEFDRTYIDSIEYIPKGVKDKISRLLKNDPNERPLIEEVINFFEDM